MKRLLLSFCLLCVILFSYADHYRVLFIGNSYTEVNNLPQLISNLASSAGDTIVFASHTPGGCTFQQHLSGALSLIRQGGWDYVVLQEQSQLPSFPYSQFMSESYPFARGLCDSIRAYNPDTKIVFYMTWGRKNGDQQNCPYYPPLCTYEGMDSLLFARYMMMAEDNRTLVSPVGYVWHYIRDHYPDIELYQSDESHPSLAGSYTAACTFYATLFHKTPMAITTDEGVGTERSEWIRRAATELVYDSLSRWSFIEPSDTIHGGDSVTVQEYTMPMFNLYPNPVTHTLTLKSSVVLEEPVSIFVYDEYGKLCISEQNSNADTYSISVVQLPAGVYFLKVMAGEKSYPIHKFIKTTE